ncbi:MAG: response regulator [Pseudomonadota bacterium]
MRQSIVETSSSSPIIPGARRARILVVDDDEQTRSVLERYLLDLGCDVTAAVSGGEALRVVDEWQPDLLLLDVMMPGIDGFEVCRQVKKQSGDKAPVIVFLTGMNSLESQEEAVTSGADDFLAKPFRRVELLIRIRSLLRTHKLASELQESHRVAQSQRDELERLGKLRDILISMIIHDLRTPIGAVIANAELLLARDDLGDHTRESVTDIQDGATAMQRLIENQLDLLRRERRPGAYPVKEVSLRAILDQIVSDVRCRATKKGLAIVVTVPEEIETITTNRDLFLRLLSTILDNSVTNSPRGGRIDLVVTSAPGGVLEVRSDDDGPTISPELGSKYGDVGALLSSGTVADAAKRFRWRGALFAHLAAEILGGRVLVEAAPAMDRTRPARNRFRVELPGCTVI